jgi:hypothetical protein
LLLSEEKYLKTTINIKKENIISTFLDSLLGNPGFSFYKEYPGFIWIDIVFKFDFFLAYH